MKRIKNQIILLIFILLLSINCTIFANKDYYYLNLKNIIIKKNRIYVNGITNLPNGTRLIIRLIKKGEIIQQGISYVKRNTFTKMFYYNIPTEYKLRIIIDSDIQNSKEVKNKLEMKKDIIKNIVIDKDSSIIKSIVENSNIYIEIEKDIMTGSMEDIELSKKEFNEYFSKISKKTILKCINTFVKAKKLYKELLYLKEKNYNVENTCNKYFFKMQEDIKSCMKYIDGFGKYSVYIEAKKFRILVNDLCEGIELLVKMYENDLKNINVLKAVPFLYGSLRQESEGKLERRKIKEILRYYEKELEFKLKKIYEQCDIDDSVKKECKKIIVQGELELKEEFTRAGILDELLAKYGLSSEGEQEEDDDNNESLQEESSLNQKTN